MMTHRYKSGKAIDPIRNRKFTLTQAWRLIDDFKVIKLVAIALVVQGLIPASCSIVDPFLHFFIHLFLLQVIINALFETL